jgi:hypothetical protein
MKSILTQTHGDIYIHCDGPRGNFDLRVFETQDLIKKWHNDGIVCSYFFQDENLGLMDSMHYALDWFFETNSHGLVLEDDLILNFPSLDEAEKLWNVLRVTKTAGVFSLANPLPSSLSKKIKTPYWSTDFFVSYAWCTTSANWKNSSRSMNDINFQLISDYMSDNFGKFTSWRFRNFMKSELAKEANNRKSCSFAWRFTLDQISKNSQSLVPTKNRIGYTGFGSESTNTKEEKIWGSDFGKATQLGFVDWNTQATILRDPQIDRYFVREFSFLRSMQISIALRTRLRNLMKKYLS